MYDAATPGIIGITNEDILTRTIPDETKSKMHVQRTISLVEHVSSVKE